MSMQKFEVGQVVVWKGKHDHDLPATVKAISPSGVSVKVDVMRLPSAGGGTFEQSCRLSSWGGQGDAIRPLEKKETAESILAANQKEIDRRKAAQDKAAAERLAELKHALKINADAIANTKTVSTAAGTIFIMDGAVDRHGNKVVLVYRRGTRKNFEDKIEHMISAASLEVRGENADYLLSFGSHGQVTGETFELALAELLR